jgi:hypothetical protein
MWQESTQTLFVVAGAKAEINKNGGAENDRDINDGRNPRQAREILKGSLCPFLDVVGELPTLASHSREDDLVSIDFNSI